jgi:hypothetical protein
VRAFEIHTPKRLPPSPYATPAEERKVGWRRWLVFALLPLAGLLRGKSTADKPGPPDANESFEQWKRQVEATRPPIPSQAWDRWIG